MREAPFQPDRPKWAPFTGSVMVPDCTATVQNCPCAEVRQQITFSLCSHCCSCCCFSCTILLLQKHLYLPHKCKELRPPRLYSPVRWQQMQQYLQTMQLCCPRESTEGLNRAQNSDLQKKRLHRAANREKCLFHFTGNRSIKEDWLCAQRCCIKQMLLLSNPPLQTLKWISHWEKC